jgi:L-alanine-DL-glutamate epimerase-like enolase superfamily enzyme
MRISQVEPFIVRVPIRREITDATHAFTHWSVTGCWIRTDEGLTGTGYTGLEGDGEELIADVIGRDYGPRLIGRDSLETSAIWEDLQWGRLHWVGRTGVTQMALAAVDIALWDLKARAAGMPLWKLLGGHKPGRIPAYNTDGGWLNWTVDELVADTSTMIEQGWSGVKIKVGGDAGTDCQRVAAVRQAIPPPRASSANGWRTTTSPGSRSRCTRTTSRDTRNSRAAWPRRSRWGRACITGSPSATTCPPVRRRSCRPT